MKYIIFPLIIILASYLSISMYSLTFDICYWAEPNRAALMLIIIATITIDLIVELLNNIE